MARTKKEDNIKTVTLELVKPVGQLFKDAYLNYGNYINNYRAIAHIADGMKISYRRLIYTATTYGKSSGLIPSLEVINSVSKLHPHSTSGIELANALLVRSGVFEGSGFFGMMQIDGIMNPHSSPRYTKNRLSDLYWEILGDLVKEVPYVDSPQIDKEPTMLPLPIGLCLYQKNLVQGLGLGVSVVYPNFSPKSLYQAYIHDDPKLLEPNVDLLLDKNNSELEKLWRTGKGRIIYAYKISRFKEDNIEGILFETKDGTDIFTPKLNKFKKLVEDGKVFIEDRTDETGSKLVVGRVPGARGITIDEIETIARKSCYDATTYNINLTDGSSVFRMPLKDWLGYTMNNYMEFVSKVNQKRICEVEFAIKVQQSLPLIADYIINTNPSASDNEISKKLGIEEEVVKEVMSKPISYLRKNKDTSERVKALTEKLKELKKFNARKFMESVINRL